MHISGGMAKRSAAMRFALCHNRPTNRSGAAREGRTPHRTNSSNLTRAEASLGVLGKPRFAPVANVTTALALVALTGCGVLNVPDLARQAVAEWRDRNGETDPCRIDAMEHCVGGSAAAAACGSACAIRLGELLEERQGDGNAMDLHNNEAGATFCGLPIRTSDAGTGAEIPDAVSCCELLLDKPASVLAVDGPCN